MEVLASDKTGTLTLNRYGVCGNSSSRTNAPPWLQSADSEREIMHTRMASALDNVSAMRCPSDHLTTHADSKLHLCIRNRDTLCRLGCVPALLPGACPLKHGAWSCLHSTTQSPCELRATCRLTLDKADIEVVDAKDAEEVLFIGALSAKWTNNDAIDKARHGVYTKAPAV